MARSSDRDHLVRRWYYHRTDGFIKQEAPQSADKPRLLRLPMSGERAAMFATKRPVPRLHVNISDAPASYHRTQTKETAKQ